MKAQIRGLRLEDLEFRLFGLLNRIFYLNTSSCASIDPVFKSDITLNVYLLMTNFVTMPLTKGVHTQTWTCMCQSWCQTNYTLSPVAMVPKAASIVPRSKYITLANNISISHSHAMSLYTVRNGFIETK